MKNWKNGRPDGWDNRNPCVTCDVRDVPNRVCDMTCVKLAKYEGVEAGADALLEALKKDAWKCIPEDQSYILTKWKRAETASRADRNLQYGFYPEPRGYLVFIPDEEVEE